MTRRPIDFQKIRAQIQPLHALRRCGWRPACCGKTEARGPCPFHGSRGRSSRSLAVYSDHVYCFKCRWSGDAVTVWAHYRRLGPYEAAVQLCAEFAVEIPYLTSR